jgi:DNA-binding NarL/FixJ family response regulator
VSQLPAPDPEAAARFAELSERERAVLQLMIEGCSNREIAEKLVISEGTVKAHVMSVLRKLELRDRVQAVIFGYESGLVRPG